MFRKTIHFVFIFLTTLISISTLKITTYAEEITTRTKESSNGINEENRELGTVLEEGIFGEAKYIFYDSGTVLFYGNGAVGTGNSYDEFSLTKNYFDNEGKEIEIKNVIIEQGITNIKSYAFQNCLSIENVELPDGLKIIDVAAFSGCKQLKNVIIPNSVEKIWGFTFQNCSSLEKVKLSASLDVIDTSLFEGCEKLKNINIPDSVKSIEYGAFRECKNLESIVLSNSLKKIENYAFYDCEKLKSIDIPNSVKSIGENAFGGCISLEKVKLPEILKVIEKSTFSSCKNLRNIEIPNTVRTIGDSAFSNCIFLETAKLSNTLETIGSKVFYNCEKLKNIVIPNTVKTIGDSVFYDCKSLETIQLSNTLETIGSEVFYSCEELKNIVIPNSVKSIGNSTFSQCKSLETVNLPDNLEKIEKGMFASCTNLRTIEIPNTVIEIGESAFLYTPLDTIKLPDSLKIINSFAFYGCKNLKTVDIPDSVETLGESAFESCKQLNSIKLSNSLKKIEKRTFSYCVNLEKVFIPKTVTEIENSAFNYRYFSSNECSIEIFYSGSEEEWGKIIIRDDNGKLQKTNIHFNCPTILSMHSIQINNISNGSVSANITSGYKNDEVSLNVFAEYGYEVEKVNVTTVSGVNIDLVKDEGEVYRFYMPDEDVIVDAVMKEKTIQPELTFIDVDLTTAHYDDVQWLASSGISTGYPDGTFRPYVEVARCDMAAFIRRLAKNNNWLDAATWKPSEADWAFADIDADSPHAEDVLWLAHAEISQGWDVGNGQKEFRPLAIVARCDMAAFLHRLASKAGVSDASTWKPSEADWTFADIDAGSPHAEDVLWLAHSEVSKGWDEGNGTTTFRPLTNVARCDMAAFLHRLDNLK